MDGWTCPSSPPSFGPWPAGCRWRSRSTGERSGAGRYRHIANVGSPDDLDDALVELLVEAYRAGGEG